MPEIKTCSEHPSSMEARINKRLQPSGGSDTGGGRVTQGSGPNRTVTTIHHSAAARQHGSDAKGEGDIYGRPRGPANTKGQI
jgi:hypothetical protein